MTAKEYLRQIQFMNMVIIQRISEKEALLDMAYGLGSPVNDPNKVQTSLSGDTMSEALAKCVDMERRIVSMIDRYIDLRDKIITEIQSLKGNDSMKYITILYKRYVQMESFEKIAVEMNYDYSWICKLHGYALKEFDRQILKSQ